MEKRFFKRKNIVLQGPFYNEHEKKKDTHHHTVSKMLRVHSLLTLYSLYIITGYTYTVSHHLKPRTQDAASNKGPSKNETQNLKSSISVVIKKKRYT